MLVKPLLWTGSEESADWTANSAYHHRRRDCFGVTVLLDSLEPRATLLRFPSMHWNSVRCSRKQFIHALRFYQVLHSYFMCYVFPIQRILKFSGSISALVKMKLQFVELKSKSKKQKDKKYNIEQKLVLYKNKSFLPIRLAYVSIVFVLSVCGVKNDDDSIDKVKNWFKFMYLLHSV